MPDPQGKGGTIKVLLRTTAAAPRVISADAAAGPEFFLLVHGTVPARRHSQRTVRTLRGEFSSPHRDLPSMTDYRVHHLVADLRSRLWASSHGSFSAWSQACSPIS